MREERSSFTHNEVIQEPLKYRPVNRYCALNMLSDTTSQRKSF